MYSPRYQGSVETVILDNDSSTDPQRDEYSQPHRV